MSPSTASISRAISYSRRVANLLGYELDEGMKNARLWSFLGVCPAVLCLQAHAALLPISLPSSSPAYADFDTTGLNLNYSYNSVSGVGTFSITNATGVSKGESYTSSSGSPGTRGAYNSSPFNGMYSLTATVQDIGGQWQVTGGSFSIEGTLLGGSTNTTLLTGTLKKGAGNFGYGTSGTGAQNAFDFLFTTGSSGSAAILADFFGAGTGEGDIIFTGAAQNDYTGSLTGSFFDNGGHADTFVPEPLFYPFAAAGTAILGLVLANRKSGRLAPIFA